MTCRRLLAPYLPKKSNDASTEILVSNLHFSKRSKELRKFFDAFGDLKTVKIRRDDGANGIRRPSAMAWVVFESVRSAHKAVRTYNDAIVDGRRMKVELMTDARAIEFSTHFAKLRLHSAAASRYSCYRHKLRFLTEAEQRGDDDEIERLAMSELQDVLNLINIKQFKSRNDWP